MWEWFLPTAERHKYYSPQIMEGGGGGGPVPVEVQAWMWGFLCGAIGAAIGLVLVWALH